MAGQYTGGLIRLQDINVTEDSLEYEIQADQRMVRSRPTGWTAVFDGSVIMADGIDGYTARIVRKGSSPGEAVQAIHDLVESFGWRVLSS